MTRNVSYQQRHDDILEAIQQHYRVFRGQPPSPGRLCQSLRLDSSTMRIYLKDMRAAGEVDFDDGAPKAIRLTQPIDKYFGRADLEKLLVERRKMIAQIDHDRYASAHAVIEHRERLCDEIDRILFVARLLGIT